MITSIGLADIPVNRLQIILSFIRAPVITRNHRGSGPELHHDPSPDIVHMEVPTKTKERKLKLVVPGQSRRADHRIVVWVVVGMRVVQVQRDIAGKILVVDKRRSSLAGGAVQPREISKGERLACRLLRGEGAFGGGGPDHRRILTIANKNEQRRTAAQNDSLKHRLVLFGKSMTGKTTAKPPPGFHQSYTKEPENRRLAPKRPASTDLNPILPKKILDNR